MNDPRYGTPAWKRLRRLILERDRARCQIRGPKCSTTAVEADHIVAVADGGDFWNPTNLRAACRPCNSGAGAAITNRRRWRYTTTEPDYESRF